MKKVFIKAVSYALPEKELTNHDLVNEFPEWTAEKVAKKIGIDKRHIVSESETSVSIAEKAAIKLFKEWDISKESIDFILLCTQSPDYFLPTSACILQDRLGISIFAGALDFNLGCSGYIYGLALAKGLVTSGIANNVLLITAETYSKFIHPKDKVNRTIFGDAASASLISNNGLAEICDFELGTDGSGAQNLMVKTGGLKYPKKEDDISQDENGAFYSPDHLYMNGTEIFSFTQEMVPKVVNNMLLKHQLELSDIDLFIFHQANKYMLNFLRKKIKIPEEKFYYYMSKVGNTVSSTIPIALSEAIKDNTIGSKDSVLLAGFGVGYSWGGTILKFDDN